MSNIFRINVAHNKPKIISNTLGFTGVVSILCLSSNLFAAPTITGFVAKMPNVFWPYNLSEKSIGTLNQQKGMFDNPDVYCDAEEHRLPSVAEFSTQNRQKSPWSDATLFFHWSNYKNNDIYSQTKLPASAAGKREIGGLFNEWGNLNSYATAAHEAGAYTRGWNQTYYWATEPFNTIARYVVAPTTGTATHAVATTKYGVVCVVDLVPTPANTNVAGN